jgi:diguanylate cyclase (GGDEF)-like protein
MGARAKIVSLQPNRYGIPGKEMTPHVRMALAALEQKIEALQARVDQLAELADRDPLIPVLNRRAFLEALQRTTAFVQRYGGDAAVLYVDLDAFKKINDDFGHPTGDAVLRHVGHVLLENVRETDFVGRIGGDEFAVILAQSNLEDAKRKATKLQDAIAASPCVHEGLEHIVNASFGVHPIAKSDDAEEALARADEAMYANKKRRVKAIV